MDDSYLPDETTANMRRHRPKEEEKPLPQPTTPAKLFRRRNGREREDCGFTLPE